MLLYRPNLIEGECLVSYLIRVSEKNGFKHIGHLLNYSGLSWKNKRAPIHQILTGELAVASYLSTLDLSESHSHVEQIYRSFQQIIDTPNLLVKYPKVCPSCIKESGYCKYQWSFLPLLACTKHEEMLVDVHPSLGTRLSWYRQCLSKFDCDSGDIRSEVSNVQPAIMQFSLYVESLILGSKASARIPIALHGLEFRESLSLIHFIAHFQARLLGDKFNPVSMLNSELGQYYQNVWKALLDWPDSFYALLSQYIDRPMSGRGVGGINKHYRDLYERLHRQQENRGIARIKVEFDRYVEMYWPGFLEPSRITRINFTEATRNIISKKEAARIIGSRPERIDKLVCMGKLSSLLFKGKAHYLRNELESYSKIIANNWSMAYACVELQITRYQLKQLLDANIINVLQRPDQLNRDWIIDKGQCKELVDSLIDQASKNDGVISPLSMAGIQKRGFSIVQLVLGMQKGKLGFSFEVNQRYPYSIKQFVAFTINK
jgi:hypothetical protein